MLSGREVSSRVQPLDFRQANSGLVRQRVGTSWSKSKKGPANTEENNQKSQQPGFG